MNLSMAQEADPSSRDSFNSFIYFNDSNDSLRLIILPAVNTHAFLECVKSSKCLLYKGIFNRS